MNTDLQSLGAQKREVPAHPATHEMSNFNLSQEPVIAYLPNIPVNLVLSEDGFYWLASYWAHSIADVAQVTASK